MLWFIFNIIAGLVPVLIVYLKEANFGSSNFISNVVTFTLTFYPSVAFGSLMFSKNNSNSTIKWILIVIVYVLTVIFYLCYINNIFAEIISVYISQHLIGLYTVLGLLALGLGLSLSWDEIINRADDCIRKVKQEWDKDNRVEYGKAMKNES